MIDALYYLPHEEYLGILQKSLDPDADMTPREALLSLLIALEEEHYDASNALKKEYKILNEAIQKL